MDLTNFIREDDLYQPASLNIHLFLGSILINILAFALAFEPRVKIEMKNKTILVPTDFSENATTAVRYSVDLATEIHAKLVVMHAFRLVETATTLNSSAVTIKEEWHQETENKFIELQESVLKNPSIPVEFSSEIGFAHNAIQEAANTHEAHLVVMGMSGKNNMILGSTAKEIIKSNNFFTLLLPPNAQYTGLKKVAVVCNKFPREHAFSQVVKLLSLQDATFCFLNIGEVEADMVAPIKLKGAYRNINAAKLPESISAINPQLVINCTVDENESELIQFLFDNSHCAYLKVPI